MTVNDDVVEWGSSLGFSGLRVDQKAQEKFGQYLNEVVAALFEMHLLLSQREIAYPAGFPFHFNSAIVNLEFALTSSLSRVLYAQDLRQNNGRWKDKELFVGLLTDFFDFGQNGGLGEDIGGQTAAKVIYEVYRCPTVHALNLVEPSLLASATSHLGLADPLNTVKFVYPPPSSSREDFAECINADVYQQVLSVSGGALEFYPDAYYRSLRLMVERLVAPDRFGQIDEHWRRLGWTT